MGIMDNFIAPPQYDYHTTCETCGEVTIENLMNTRARTVDDDGRSYTYLNCRHQSYAKGVKVRVDD